jgi:formiminotetrahydrofolate cyclodeaminase
MKRKQVEIKTMNEKLNELKQVQQDLIKLGDDDFQVMNKGTTSMKLAWESAKRDAIEIMGALEKGLKVAVS